MNNISTLVNKERSANTAYLYKHYISSVYVVVSF